MKHFFALILFWSVSVTAQMKYTEIGLGTSGTYFHGDVGQVNILPSQSANQLVIRNQYGWHWGTRVSYTRGFLSGSDLIAPQLALRHRGISFRTEIQEFAFMAEFNYWPYATGTKYKQSFFLFGGLGLTQYNPQGFQNLDSVFIDLRPLGTEGQGTDLSNTLPYGNLTTTLPFGLGYRRSIARDFSISVEMGWRRYGSDYLDDTSGKYVDAELLELEKGEWAAYFSNPGNVQPSEGLYRGNPDNRDWSIFAGVTIFYNIVPRNERCEGF